MQTDSASEAKRASGPDRPLAEDFLSVFWPKYLPVLLIGALAVSYFAYIHAYGVNVLYWDEWQVVPLYKQFVEGPLNHSLVALFKTQHNDNLMFFPYLVMILLDFFTHFNNKAGMYLGAAFQAASFGILWLLADRDLPKDRYKLWYAVPLACLMFSFCQYKNMLWGFQPAWFMVTFFTLLALLSLDESLEADGTQAARGKFFFCLSILCGTVASFSSVQGFIVWPSGLAFLLLRKPRNSGRSFGVWMGVLWLGAAVLGGIIFLAFMDMGQLGVRQGVGGLFAAVLGHPLYDLRFILSNWGAVMWIQPEQALLLGFTIGLSVLLAVAVIARAKNRGAYALPAALLVFGLIYSGMLLVGRSVEGIGAASDSHYSAYNLLLLAGVYLTLVNGEFLGTISEIGSRSMKTFIALACVVFVCRNVYWGVESGREWQVQQLYNAEEALTLKEQPHFKIERTLFGNYNFVAAQVDYLRSRYLSVFHGEPPKLSPEVADLISPPEAFMALEKAHPRDREALQRLWDVYSIAPDLQNAFPPRSENFAYDLVRWAYGEAKGKEYYLDEYLAPYGDRFISLFHRMGAREPAAQKS